MATTFNREQRPVDITQLKNELNESVNITATVIDITNDTAVSVGNNLTINWNVDLLSAEVTEMDTIVSAHVAQIQDVSLYELPMSSLGDKLAIHSSTKPAQPGKEFYLVWTGSGDDVTGSPPQIAAGQLLELSLVPGSPKTSIDVKFAPEFGDVYIHEGYAKWEQGGSGDHLCAVIVTEPSALQTVVNLDLEVVNNWVKYASGGAGTGTHGFAATPVLLQRTKSKDGDWDYTPAGGLVPNLAGTGEYKISDIEREVHNYINKIPTIGSSYGYTVLTSDESAYLPKGYFIRVAAHNVSDTTWSVCVFMEVFREQTAVP